jgi:UPF0716 protein FxsA
VIFLAVFLLIAIPALEIWVFILVGGAIGFLPTVLLLLVSSLAGALLLRHEGGRAWRAFTQATVDHRVPHREVIDGALVIVGGTLMLAPGFVTDAVGLLCLLPVTRSVFRRLAMILVTKRMGLVGAAGAAGGFATRRVRSKRGPAAPKNDDGDPPVIEGEIEQ